MGKNLWSQLANTALTYGPKALATPAGLVPFTLKAKILEQLLNHLLAEQISSQELDFLRGHWVAVSVTDLALSFEVGFAERCLVRAVTAPEVTFTANSTDLVLVAAAKEDPDTLFFQRRLSIEGDTELGLEVKNMLLAVDLQRLPAAIRQLLQQLANALQTLQSAAMPQALAV